VNSLETAIVAASREQRFALVGYALLKPLKARADSFSNGSTRVAPGTWDGWRANQKRRFCFVNIDDIPAARPQIGARDEGANREVVQHQDARRRCGVMEGSDVCFAPVLSMEEASRYPHNRQRGTFVKRTAESRPRAAFQPHSECDPAASRQAD